MEKHLEGVALVRAAAREFWLCRDPNDNHKCGLLYRCQQWDKLIRTVSQPLQIADQVHIEVEPKLVESEVQKT